MIAIPRPAHDHVRVLDGGTGSELRRRGMPLSADAWSALAGLTHYELLCDVHADYIRAGADVIITNTFATTRFVLDAAGYGEQFQRITRRTVEAAHEARDSSGRSVAIAGSISCLPPAFDVARYPDAAAEARAYRELADTLAAAGVDLLVLEMLQDTVHAPLACAAARASGLPFWLGVSCRLVDGDLVGFDLSGVTLEACLDAVLPFEPEAVTVMHSPIDAVVPALEAVRSRWPGAVGAYPEIASAEVTPGVFATDAHRWIAAGATIVGGCCGTTPAHVGALAGRLPRPDRRRATGSGD